MMSTKKLIAAILVLGILGLTVYGVKTAIDIRDELRAQKIELQNSKTELNKTSQSLESLNKVLEKKEAEIKKLKKEKKDQAQKLNKENNKLRKELQVRAQKRKAQQAVLASAAAQTSSGNGYVWGNCTWYVKNRLPSLPNDLGNGGGWTAAAAARGYATGSTPRPGAVAEQSGHVAYVESVNGGMVTISEMNYAGGVGVKHVRTVPASTFYGYIYA